MKNMKMMGIAAIAAMALMAIGASTASATTLETNGVKNTSAVEIKASLESGNTWIIQKTDGTFGETCTISAITFKTSTSATGTAVSGPVSLVSAETCTNEKVVVDKPGSFSVENIAGTTNGTVKWAVAELTMPSPFGNLNCQTGTGTDIGTFTGKASGQATIDIHAVLNCGILAPSATWDASYLVTSGPNGVTS